MLRSVFSKAREKARQVICMNTQKQIGLSFNMYADERDGYFLVVNMPSGKKSAWAYMLCPYLEIKWIYTWPSGGPPVFYCLSAKVWSGECPLRSLSYGYNRFFYEPNAYPPGVDKRSRVRNPSFCLLAVDLEYEGFGDGCNISTYIMCTFYNPESSLKNCDARPFAYRHSEGLDILFVDGHVEWKKNRGDGYPSGFYFYEGSSMY